MPTPKKPRKHKSAKNKTNPADRFRPTPPKSGLSLHGMIGSKVNGGLKISMPSRPTTLSDTRAASDQPPVPPQAPPPEPANDDPYPGWPTIDRILTGAVPDVEFPLPVLPDAAAKWILETARAAGVPVGFVAMVFLAAVAAAIGNARVANPLPGWFEANFLFTVLVGDPSSGKSPALGGSLAVYRAVETLERAEHHATYGSPEASRPKRAGRLREKLNHAAETQSLDIPDLQVPVTSPVPPVPQLICGVTTLPGLEQIALANPKGLLIVQDEITKFLEQKGEFRSVLLSLYNAESHRRTTAKGDVDIAHLGAGLAGGIQPSKLEPLLPKMSADGLGGRLLLVMGQAVPLARVTESVDPAQMVAALRYLRGLEMDFDESGVRQPQAVPFTTAAGDLIHTHRVEARKMQDREIGNLCAFIGKSTGTVARLSLILTFLDAAVDNRLDPEEVDIAAVERAAALFDDFLLPMARAAFEVESLPPVVREARDLVAALRRRGERYISNRELLRAHGQKLRTNDKLLPVVVFLIDEGVLRLVEGPYTGGCHSDGYDVNPRLWKPGSEGAA